MYNIISNVELKYITKKNYIKAQNKYDNIQLEIKNLIKLYNLTNFIDYELLDYFENI